MWEHWLSYNKIRSGRGDLGVRFRRGDRSNGSSGEDTLEKSGVGKVAKIV